MWSVFGVRCSVINNKMLTHKEDLNRVHIDGYYIGLLHLIVRYNRQKEKVKPKHTLLIIWFDCVVFQAPENQMNGMFSHINLTRIDQIHSHFIDPLLECSNAHTLFIYLFFAMVHFRLDGQWAIRQTISTHSETWISNRHASAYEIMHFAHRFFLLSVLLVLMVWWWFLSQAHSFPIQSYGSKFNEEPHEILQWVWGQDEPEKN